MQQLRRPVAADGDRTSGGRGNTRRGRRGATATADATAAARRGPHDGSRYIIILYTISQQYLYYYNILCDVARHERPIYRRRQRRRHRDRNNIMNALRRGSPTVVLCGGGRLTRAPVPLSRMPVPVPAGARP